jgi:hydroxymethylbilane synthase
VSTHPPVIVVGACEGPVGETLATDLVRRLGRAHPDAVFRRKVVATVEGRNGKILVRLGGGSDPLFMTQTEAALMDGAIDIAVRPLEEIALHPVVDLALAAILARSDPREALCGASLRALPRGGRVGASSHRRTAQLLALRPDLEVIRLKGTTTTQLRLLRGLRRLDGVVSSVAGLERLRLASAITERLGTEEFPPAPGQGAVAAQIRASDDEMRDLLAPLHDVDTATAVEAERSLLAELHADRAAPIGAHAELDGPQLRLLGQVTALDGRRVARAAVTGPPDHATDLGRRLAHELLAMGADQILTDIRPSTGTSPPPPED